jgi:hypothetical protein
LRDSSTSHQLAERNLSKWVYTTIRLHDGERILEPTHVSFDHVVFPAPPELTGSRVEIVVANGPDELRSVVDVLPHDPSATEIPIRLVTSR